jgi:hypothetical protein
MIGAGATRQDPGSPAEGGAAHDATREIAYHGGSLEGGDDCSQFFVGDQAIIARTAPRCDRPGPFSPFEVGREAACRS